MIFHRDPMQMMTHLNEKHGMDAVMGMAELYDWSRRARAALGRFDALPAQKHRRDVRLRRRRERTPRHPRDALRLGDGRGEPIPARP